MKYEISYWMNLNCWIEIDSTILSSFLRNISKCIQEDTIWYKNLQINIYVQCAIEIYFGQFNSKSCSVYITIQFNN